MMRFSTSSKLFAYYAVPLTSLLQHSSATVLGVRADSGCGTPHQTYNDGESREYNISSSGGIRTYNIHLPQDYNSSTKYPLIISYHGGTEDKTQQEGISQFSNNTINPNMIAVYPQGIEVGTMTFLGRLPLLKQHQRIPGKARPLRTHP